VDFVIFGKVVVPIEGMTVESNTAHKKTLDIPIERFLASLRFEQRGKLDQMGIEIGSFDWKSVNFGSPQHPSVGIAG
jgi:hypothetical protein